MYYVLCTQIQVILSDEGYRVLCYWVLLKILAITSKQTTCN